jgi:hypothetical protein
MDGHTVAEAATRLTTSCESGPESQLGDSWQEWRQKLHEEHPDEVDPTYHQRDWHPDFHIGQPITDEHGRVRYPSRGCNMQAWVREQPTLNKKCLLKRGWTRTAIKRILGEPDRRGDNHRFSTKRAECLYNRERVLKAEEANLTRYRQVPPEDPLEIADPMFEPARGPGVQIWATCKHCRQGFNYVQAATGRIMRYCSIPCRNRAARKRSAKKNKQRAEKLPL